MPEPTDSPWPKLADAAFRQAAAKVVRRAKQSGTPLVVWEQDRIRIIPPDEVQEGKADGPAAPAVPHPG